MNFFFRVLTAIYAVIAAVLSTLVMISPFSNKGLMKNFLDWADVTLYRSDKYNVVVFLLGLILLLLNLFILFSGIRFKGVNKYICFKNDNGQVRVSANSVESIALGLARKSKNVREAKSKVRFKNETVEILMKLSVYPDTHVPNLSRLLQNQIKDAVESMTELQVSHVDINIEGVHAAPSDKE
ncbi:MAG: alkaline shock response membrane anchor protein AmaP [Clostridia bacterium]|nr:alkaline shock response membrane anchor protein AmaP [Clostridia bacterium]MBP5780438.1 alkaline shock response membrane anchor protein AmaP [Clostridia bacterium]